MPLATIIQPPHCPHGGAFFQAIGERFDQLERRHRVINADVLDAWFDPAPAVLEVLRAHLGWLVRTSPPTRADGLREVLADYRGLDPDNLVVGPGSSQLIHLALPQLADAGAVLIPEPSYGEYRHLVRSRDSAGYQPLPLDPATNFRLDAAELCRRAEAGNCRQVVLVNPNNPTGEVLDRRQIEALLAGLPPRCRLWIDETYIDYAEVASAETLVAGCDRLIICKSLSKAYALSGLRVAYLVAPAAWARSWRAAQPPWHCALPAQLAATTALSPTCRNYYVSRWRESARLRADVATKLSCLPHLAVHPPGTINALLCACDPTWGPAAQLIAAAAAEDLYLRDCNILAASFGGRYVRISVKDPACNARMLAILAEILARDPSPGPS